MKYKTTPADVAAEEIAAGIESDKYRVLIGGNAKQWISLPSHARARRRHPLQPDENLLPG